MKIAMHSNASMKFMQDIRDHWEAKGHEIFYEPGANPELTRTCDLTYIDFLDNNFYCLFNGPGGDNNAPGWKSYPKKGPIVVRAIDIDIWMGRHRDTRIWEYMDHMIVINPFYLRMIQEEGKPPPGKLHLIKCGVNLDKFTFRNKENEYKIALVTGNMWEAKATYEAIRLLALLRKQTKHDWTLHIRGDFIPPEWHRAAHEHLLDVLEVRDKVTVYSNVGDMNDWYNDKDYILVTSYKEAFSYAAAEGMAKGLKPVLNNFFGAEEIWDKKYLYTNWDDAVEMFQQPIESEKYRKYIEKNYSLERMLKEYDELLGT